MEKKLTIPAKTEELHKVQAFVRAFLEDVDVSVKASTQLDIIVEEIFVNIAYYAYAPNEGNATIMVDFVDDGRISITFSDTGIPYNPLANEDPDVTLSATERRIGGLGIFMTKKFAEELHYEYKDGANVLTIVKALS